MIILAARYGKANRFLLEPISKIVDRGSEQGARWRKSGAYTVVCEHFEPARNAALDP